MVEDKVLNYEGFLVANIEANVNDFSTIVEQLAVCTPYCCGIADEIYCSLPRPP